MNKISLSRLSQLRPAAIFALGLTLSAGGLSVGYAQETPQANTPVVVEFFTSQACSSCIPAAKHFRELAQRDDVVALSWHVDYWNTLKTRSGAWVDPYSSKACTTRQRKYNINLRKRNSVFTPQMVISGAAEAVGTKEETISQLINDVGAEKQPVAITAAYGDNGEVSFTVGESATGGNAYLVIFKPETMTDVTSGEIKDSNITG